MASKVFFIKASSDEPNDVISQKARKLFKAADLGDCFSENDFTAVKLHVGEGENNTHVPAPCLKGIIEELQALKTRPFLTDTSVLYFGHRHNAVDHHMMAARHGFGPDVLGVPFIVADGLVGTSETAVRIDCEINEQVFIASEILKCQSILSVAHFTGHPATCAAATIKTLGMGCASKKGKMAQHAALKLSVNDNCQLCRQCLEHCPADAITLDAIKAHIDQDKCIGCAECLAYCRFGAVKLNWGSESQILQKSCAEHALAVLKDKRDKAAFFNFVFSVTSDCDCFSTPDMKKIVEDIGILASRDPVAIDKAAIDLVEAKAGKKLAQLIGNKELNPNCQLIHAKKIGLGTLDYDLIEIDEQVQ